MRGRKPKPTALLKLTGTLRPVRHGKRAQEPKPSGSLAELTPPHFDAAHLKEWRRVLEHAPAGVLSQWDRDILEHYVRLRVRFLRAWQAQEDMDRGKEWPYLVEGANGLRVSPYIRIQNHCIDQMTRLQAEMGMTPASRCRLSVAPPARPPAADDTWARIARLRLIAGGLGKPAPTEVDDGLEAADDDAPGEPPPEDEPPAA
jgi:P27 family predicted phage terminase small subunit